MNQPVRPDADPPREAAAARQLPAWHWDSKDLALRPRCPVCNGRLIASGNRLTCLIVGFRHYDEPVAPLLDHVLDLLRPPST